MYRHVPCAATRSCERLPPPGRIDIHTGQFTIAIPVARDLAQATPRPERALHQVQRLARDDEGRVIAGKLATALALAAGN